MSISSILQVVFPVLVTAWGVASTLAQDSANFTSVQILTNKEVLLRVGVKVGQACRIEHSPDLTRWEGLTTFVGAAANQQTDSSGPFVNTRFYRISEVTASNVVTGDHLSTAEGEVTLHPINHATFVMTWNGKVIHSDPVGGAGRFTGLPKSDLILVTHSHSDHFDATTINAVKGTNAVILVPQAVYQSLPAALKSIATVLNNGAKTNLLGLEVEAVPAYNLTSTYHPKGVGNGYVVTIGGKRIYISGDTEDVPELRALPNIDVAFVCMNLPFTMTVDKAADATRQFQPRVIYPYHFSDSDVNRFKRLVGTNSEVEVRLRKWY